MAWLTWNRLWRRWLLWVNSRLVSVRSWMCSFKVSCIEAKRLPKKPISSLVLIRICRSYSPFEMASTLLTRAPIGLVIRRANKSELKQPAISATSPKTNNVVRVCWIAACIFLSEKPTRTVPHFWSWSTMGTAMSQNSFSAPPNFPYCTSTLPVWRARLLMSPFKTSCSMSLRPLYAATSPSKSRIIAYARPFSSVIFSTLCSMFT